MERTTTNQRDRAGGPGRYAAPPRGGRDRQVATRRAVAVSALAIAVLGAAYLVASPLLSASEEERVAGRFAEAWERGKFADMWGMLTPAAQSQVEPATFAAQYQTTAATATATGVSTGEPEEQNGAVVVPVTIETAAFGPMGGDVALRVNDGRIAWTPQMVFPGLSEGETLSRRSDPPQRAAILDRDGDVIVEGDAGARQSTLGELAGAVAKPDDPVLQERLYERGFPEDQPAGVSGLELIFEEKVAGTPGGVLRAGTRQIATAEPRPAEPVRTTLDPGLQEAATAALADRVGGVVVLDAGSAEVRAVAGGGLSNAQPPGSTFKIVTASAALEDGVVKPSTQFPVAGYAVIDGFKLKNAHGGELCGGTFHESFVHSCNSVFAPVGADVGAESLVEMAERYGVNRRPSIPGAAESTMPPPSEYTSDLDVAATAIGQGQLLVTPLELASITQAIARGGKLVPPSLDPAAPKPEAQRVVSKKVADEIGKMMVDVVAYGTGASAAVTDVTVAGKTGTAEVGLQTESEKDDPQDHAWFTAYAPAKKPKLVVTVFIANAGFGGDVAAPVAGGILEAGLGIAPSP
jgi:transpeptidase family protein